MQAIIADLKSLLPYITNVKSKYTIILFIEDGFADHQKYLYHELKRILQFECYKPQGEKWIKSAINKLEFYDSTLKSIGFKAAIELSGQPLL